MEDVPPGAGENWSPQRIGVITPGKGSMANENENNDQNQDTTQVTREQTLERENALLRKQTAELEDLLLATATQTQVRVPDNNQQSTTQKPDATKDETKPATVKEVVEAVKKELVEPLKQEMAAKDFETRKNEAVAEIGRLRKNHKDFDLYLPEIKETAKRFPDMSMTEAYNFAKTQTGPKTPARQSPTDPKGLSVEQTKSSSGDGRWSEVEKVTSRKQADQLHNASFNSAVEDALAASGLG
jgi:hypothetical protein